MDDHVKTGIARWRSTSDDGPYDLERYQTTKSQTVISLDHPPADPPRPTRLAALFRLN
jgi:hypothetical protein